ncbi:hypothetical protein L0F63_007425, partial [Massospora cicadina]
SPLAALVWNCGETPPTVFHLSGKRARTGSFSHSKPMGQFVLPKDLDTHLAPTQAVPCCPLVLPQSNMRYSLRFEYGKLFLYHDQAIIEIAQVVMTPTSFINFRPYKGYFDLSFTCKADAATAATVSLVFQGTPLPTTQTWIPADTTLVVQFAGLPTHIPLKDLIDGPHQERADDLSIMFQEEATAEEAAKDEPPDPPPLSPWRDKRLPLPTLLEHHLMVGLKAYGELHPFEMQRFTLMLDLCTGKESHSFCITEIMQNEILPDTMGSAYSHYTLAIVTDTAFLWGAQECYIPVKPVSPQECKKAKQAHRAAAKVAATDASMIPPAQTQDGIKSIAAE